MKKLISFFLSVVMLFSITACVDLSAYAYTSGDFEYSVSGSNATITGYTGSSTSVTIPSKIDGYTVTSIGDDAFFYYTSLTSVTIPNSVTSIGNDAFSNCTSLTSVTIPNSVTSIGSSAFSYCTSLTSVTIPNSVTSIGDYAFEDCTSLTSVTIPNSVTSIGESAFAGCTSLTSVIIGDSVTSIGDGAFSRVNNIVYSGSASGSPWGAKSVNGYVDGYLVYKDSTKKELLGCSAQATSVTIPNSVESIGDDAFYNCTSLTSVTIPNSVISIGYRAFYKCSRLTSIIIGNSVTSIGDYAFYNCTSITSVTIPNSVTSVGEYAFSNVNNIVYYGSASGTPWGAKSVNGYVDGYLVYKDSTKELLLGCSSQATSVTIPNSVTSIDTVAFIYCTNLNKVNISSIEAWCNISFSNSYSNPLYYAKNLYLNDELVTELVIPDSVTSIGDWAFSNCTSLTSATIPNSVTSIGEYAFANCTSLTSVTIPNSVTSILDDAFIGCTSLTSVKIPNSVTSIGDYAFSECTSLTSVTIPNSVTSIGNDAFSYCASLTSVTIPNSVTSIGDWAFYLVNNIEYNGSASGSPWRAKSVNGYVDGYLVYKDSTKKELLGCSAQATSVTIPDSVTSIGNVAFYKCTSLNKVNISSIESWCKISFSDYSSNPLCYAKNLYLNDELVTELVIPNSVTSIGDDAFECCTSLTSVTIPNSVTSIGEYAFANCTSLISVTIPNSVTSIGNHAFYECRSLTSVTIPNSVTSIGDDTFEYCTSLTSVTIPNSVTSIGEYVFNNCSSLILLTIPSSVTSIGRYAFNSCTSLIDVYYIGSETQWKNISIESYNDVLLKANIHYINDGTSCEHSWSEWIYNGDAVYVSATEYTDGTATRTCTVCGESETKTIEGTGLLRARTATCEFASEVRAMIGVKTEQTKLFSNVYCKFTREDGKEIIVNSDKSTLSQDESTAYYPFAITPQSLHSDIKVQFYAVTNDGITVWGQEYTYNMMDNYIKKQIANTTNESWRKLLVELVYYGYENQIKSGWKLDQLLIDELTDEQKALHSTEELTLNKYLNTSYVVCENPLTTWRSVNLEYGASTNPIFRTRALALTDDIKAVVTIEGDEKVYTYNYSDPDDAKYFKVDADVASDTTGIYFTFGELPAKRLRSKMYVTLYKGDTPITNTLEYSAETYCNSQSGKDPNMTEQNTRITQQLMRYGNAARAYFGI